jgi:hypothetical protein
MPLIDAVGVLQYYYLWNMSYQSRLIMINGLIYHGSCIFFDKNNSYIIFLRNYDLSVNIIIMMRSSYINPYTIPFIILGNFFYYMNTFLIPNSKYKNCCSSYTASLMHVLFIQFYYFCLLMYNIN